MAQFTDPDGNITDAAKAAISNSTFVITGEMAFLTYPAEGYVPSIYPAKGVVGQVPITSAPAQKTPGFEAIFAGIVVLMVLTIRKNLHKRLR